MTELYDTVHLLTASVWPRSVRINPATMKLATSIGIEYTPHGRASQWCTVAAHAINRWLPVPGALLAMLPTDLPDAGLGTLPEHVGVTFGPLDRIHAFRLLGAPLTAPFARANPGARLTLDIDDIESIAARRMADMYRARSSRHDRARVLAAAAVRRAKEEQTWLPRFHRVYACSTVDRDKLRARFPGLDVARLPNTFDAPASPAPPRRRSAGDRLRLLFVGSLAFAPNDDALRYFATAILPRWPEWVELHVVGAHLDPETRALLGDRAIIHGWLLDVAVAYAAADVVVVPIRTGGGTRIKILEAFAHDRPVVSTSVGAEGLAVRHEREILLADTPEDFVAACSPPGRRSRAGEPHGRQRERPGSQPLRPVGPAGAPRHVIPSGWREYRLHRPRAHSSRTPVKW